MESLTKHIKFKSPTDWIKKVIVEIDPNLEIFSTIGHHKKFADYMWDLYTIQCAEHNQPVKVHETRFKIIAADYFNKNRLT